MANLLHNFHDIHHTFSLDFLLIHFSLSEQDWESTMDGIDTEEEEYFDAEILDEMTTHRGELKLRSVGVRDPQVKLCSAYNF